MKFSITMFCCLVTIAAYVSSCQGSGATERATGKPNIIVILADDAGYADFGFMGSELPTPNIDKLAKSGIVFTDAHVTASVCSPSRAGLLTGRYQQRFGHEANIPPPGKGMNPEEKTIGDAMQLAGYKTGIIGKWHVGAAAQFHPNNRGFDEFWGFLAGSRSYFYDSLKNDQEFQPREILHNSEHVDFNGYLTDAFSEEAVKFVHENQRQPFFLYLAYNAVHTPLEAKKEDLAKFKDNPRAKLAAMTLAMDRGIGKLLDELNVDGLRKNTLIFFLSDNGGATNNQSSNYPLKGFKGNKFEGGHRVPFVMSWPDYLPNGKKFDGLTSSMDIFATSIATAKLDKTPGKPLDGVNLIPYLLDRKAGSPHRQLFWRKLGMAAARDGNFKLIRLDGYGYRMYNLQNDPGESIDLSAQDSVEFNKLEASLDKWEEEMVAPLWTESDAWQQVTFEIHKALMENREVTIKSPKDLYKLKTK